MPFIAGKGVIEHDWGHTKPHAPPQAQSATLQKQYLDRNFPVDISAIFQATQPQQELLKQSVSNGSNENGRLLNSCSLQPGCPVWASARG